ncbi:MAG: hypothetical protein OIF56_08350, partial [Cohaesibacter sp.]|nr:hypothetical protein [Cohaesibacter sp.]
NGDGIREKVAWVSPDDAILVHDKNGNGQIDGISEVFGNGQRDGFEELADYDSNKDRIIDAKDAEFSELRLWQDKNGNGSVDAGELKTLGELGIKSLALHSTLSNDVVAGNQIGRDGTFTKNDGSTGSVRSVWFETRPYDRIFVKPDGYKEDPEAGKLPDLKGYGKLGNLRYAMSVDSSLKAAVKALVSSSATMSGSDFMTAFEAILVQWAGAKDVATDSRGQHINGQHLAVLEAFYGTNFSQVVRNSNPSPNPTDAVTGKNLEDLYQGLLDGMAARFASQSANSWILLEKNWSNLIDHQLLPFVAGNTLKYDQAAGKLTGNLDKVVLTIATQAALSDSGSLKLILDRLPLIKALRLDLYGHGADNKAKFVADLKAGIVKHFKSASLAEMAAAYVEANGAIQQGDDAANVLNGNNAAELIVGGKGDDTLDGKAGADSYVYSLGDGKDVIKDLDYSSNIKDSLLLHKIKPGEITLSASGNDLVLAMPDGGSVTLKNQLYNTYNGIERIVFDNGTVWDRAEIKKQYLNDGSTDGNDSITGSNSDDIITGGKGDDVINGKTGSDSYIYNLGDGKDVVTDLDYSSGVKDKIILKGITPAQVALSLSGKDLVLTMPDGGSITLKNQFYNAYNGIEQVVFDDGTIWDRSELTKQYLADQSTSGNDTIIGSYAAETITAGKGDDVIDGKKGADSYVYRLGDGQDVITDLDYSSGVKDKIVLKGITPAQVKLAQSGKNLVMTMPDGGTITVKNQFENAYNGIEEVVFDDGTIWAVSDFKGLYLASVSTSGNDTITGFSGSNDVITGGKGDDIIDGKSGADSYVYNLGDGKDVITDLDYNSGVKDKIILKGITPAQVTLSLSGKDLILTMPDGGAIKLKNQFHNAYNGIEQVVFDDGTIWDRNEITRQYLVDQSTGGNDTIIGSYAAETITAGKGDDIINGKTGADSYVYRLGDGQDVITDLDYSSGVKDKIILKGITPAQVTLSLSGKDIILTMPDGGSIKLKNQFHNAYNGIEQVVFDDGTIWDRNEITRQYLVDQSTNGNDTIIGSYAGEVITAGKGDDVINGKTGADSYVYNLGDGKDVITDLDYSSGVKDKIILKGITPAQVALSLSGKDLVLTMPDGGTITIKDQIKNAYNGIEQVVFDDGTTWTAADLKEKATGPVGINRSGTDQADTLQGTSDNDGFDGGKGDDKLYGKQGSDIYHYAMGDGSDFIDDEDGSTSSKDILKFKDINADNVELTRDGKHLKIKIKSTGEVLTIDEQFYSSSSHYGIEEIQFADGSKWDRSKIQLKAWFRGTDSLDTIQGTDGNNVIVGGKGDDKLYGKQGSDIYHYASGDGSDLIDDEDSSTSSKDILKFKDINADDVELTRDGVHLKIKIKSTGETITIDEQFYSSSSHYGIEEIQFADGSKWDRDKIQSESWFRGTSGVDTIQGTDGNNVFIAGKGDDKLYGKQGSDIYHYASGDGSDLIDDADRSTASKDVLRFTNINADDVALTRDGPHLKIKIKSTGETITVDDQFYSDSRNYGIEEIQFADGNKWDRATIKVEAFTIRGDDQANVLNGSAGSVAETFLGGKGDDKLLGGRGDDIYVYSSGDGNDEITEIGRAGDKDVLKFKDIKSTDVVVTRSLLGGNDLLITIVSTGEIIKVVGHFRNKESGLEEIAFSDNVTWDRATIQSKSVFKGTDQANTITGSAANDTLIGGKGYDLLNGAGGSDVFVYSKVDGSDTIDESGSSSDIDTLKFTDLNADDITFKRSTNKPNDLLITVKSTGSVITVDDHFKGKATGLEKIIFADGSSLSRADLNWKKGTDQADTLRGSSDAENILGGKGDDKLYGGAGGDIYHYASGDGNDLIDDEGGSTTAKDILKLKDLNAADIELSRKGNDLLVKIKATGEIITIDEQFYSSSRNYGIEEIQFADGTKWDRANIQSKTDILVGSDAADTLRGSNIADQFDAGKGNDKLYGGASGDIYHYASGDGNDFIDDEGTSSSDKDILKLKDLNAADIELSRNGNNLLVKIKATGEIITIDEQFYSSSRNYGIEAIQFADGTKWDRANIQSKTDILVGSDAADTLRGSNIADQFDAGKGNDKLYGGNSGDIYHYASGDGSDFIDDEDGSTSAKDILKLKDLNAADIELSRNGKDLLVKIKATGEVITIDEQFYSLSRNYGIEEIQFADGTKWDRVKLQSDAWFRGTDGDDSLTGSSGNDTL